MTGTASSVLSRVFPVFETELLCYPIKGVVIITTYYSDGSVVDYCIQKYPRLFFDRLETY
jgi:hypothetical protein